MINESIHTIKLMRTINSKILELSVVGPALLTISINATVHIVMYAHYFLSAYGIKSRWTESLKKSITKLQLVSNVMVGSFK